MLKVIQTRSLLAGLVLVGVMAGTVTAAPAAELCRQSLDEPIRWLRPGTVVDDGVLVVDAIRHEVRKIHFDGRVQSWAHKAPTEPISLPAIVRSTTGPDGSILVEDAGEDRIVKFDAKGNYQGEFSFEGQFHGERLSIDVKAAFDWVPYHGGYFGLFAYDTGPSSERPDERGVIHLSKDGDEKVVHGPVRTFANNYAAVRFYQRNPATLTADPNGEFAYFIAPNGRVIRYSDNRDEWKEWSVGKPLPRLSSLPSLQYPGASARRALEHYREIERSYLLTGLAYSSGKIYLLEKEAPLPGRGLAWHLLQLDPQSGTLTRRSIDSKAAHITLLASDERLVLLEQRGVFGRGSAGAPEMPVSSMIVVPVSQLDHVGDGPFARCQPAD